MDIPCQPSSADLREIGAEVFRTDLDGQVDVITDGKSVEVRTFTGREFSVAGR